MISTAKSTAVVVMSKSPAVDLCKTRLTDKLSQRQANDLQTAMIDDLFAKITPELGYDLWVATPRKESLAYFKHVTSRLLVQKGHDLGEKMYNLSSTLFAKSYRQVVLIGSDLPFMTSNLLMKAKQLLESCDCVIGPAVDGGYYLMGISRPIPEIFSGIPWSTAQVLRQTLQTLDSLSMRYEQLSVYRDVDDWADLAYYSSPEFESWIPNTARWLSQHMG